MGDKKRFVFIVVKVEAEATSGDMRRPTVSVFNKLEGAREYLRRTGEGYMDSYGVQDLTRFDSMDDYLVVEMYGVLRDMWEIQKVELQ